MQTSAAITNLQRLLWLRFIMIAALAIATTASTLAYQVNLPISILLGIGFGMLVLNGLTWLRLRYTSPVKNYELLLQLLVDVSLLTTLFYFTGGYTNPFVWMYLLPLSISAVALSWQATWAIAILSITCYSGLMLWYEPLAMSHMQHGLHDMSHTDSTFNIHLFGMWIGFVISACVISYFVQKIGVHIRQYDQLLAESREKILKSERLLALGALATGAAHELGTPLSTMAILTKELSNDHQQDQELSASLAILRGEVERCKSILSTITASAGAARSDGATRQSLDQWINAIVSRWSEMRPQTSIHIQRDPARPDMLIAADLALTQAINNLLNNAADASPEKITLSYKYADDILKMDISDTGSFVEPQLVEKLGMPFFTTKKEHGGMGLGLFLAQSIIEQLGGTLSFKHDKGIGTTTHITIPLSSIKVSQ